MPQDNCQEFYNTFPRGLRQLAGTDKNDTYFGRDSFNNYAGIGGNDRIIGVTGRSLFDGGDGNDYIQGGNLNDLLIGGNGNDLLVGGGGNDCLTGGAGNNTLIGGQGGDTFDVFSFRSAAIPGVNYIIDPGGSIDGVSRVSDFKSGEDGIKIAIKDFSPLNGKEISLGVVKSDAAAATNGAAIVYNSSNGNLFLNFNGANAGFGGDNGAVNYQGGLFATLSGSPQLNFGDLIIV
jgi:Ca2+-binding RTX toxin-like protein